MNTSEALDAAQAAKEVAVFTALALMRTKGDPDAALAVLDGFDGVCPPEDEWGVELDACALSAQAIREAAVMRGGR